METTEQPTILAAEMDLRDVRVENIRREVAALHALSDAIEAIDEDDPRAYTTYMQAQALEATIMTDLFGIAVERQ